MLPEYCATDPVPVLCCTTLFATAEGILTIGWDALQDCLDPAACDEISPIVAAAEPHLATTQYLAVWPREVLFPPLPRTGVDKMMTVQRPVISFGVKFVEDNYPTLEDVAGNIIEPLPAAVEWAGRHSLAHAEMLYRSVVGSLTADNPCGTLKAVGPLSSFVGGGLIAWQFSVGLESPWR